MDKHEIFAEFLTVSYFPITQARPSAGGLASESCAQPLVYRFLSPAPRCKHRETVLPGAKHPPRLTVSYSAPK